MSPQATEAEELAGVGGTGAGCEEVTVGPGVGAGGMAVAVGGTGVSVGAGRVTVAVTVAGGSTVEDGAGASPLQAANRRTLESRSSGWSARTGVGPLLAAFVWIKE